MRLKLDKCKHIVYIIITWYSYCISVNLNVIDSNRNYCIGTWLDIEEFTVLEVLDRIVCIAENENVIVKVRRNKLILSFVAFGNNCIITENNEVVCLVVIEVYNSVLCEIFGSFGKDISHFPGVLLYYERITYRTVKKIEELNFDNKVLSEFWSVNWSFAVL